MKNSPADDSWNAGWNIAPGQCGTDLSVHCPLSLATPLKRPPAKKSHLSWYYLTTAPSVHVNLHCVDANRSTLCNIVCWLYGFYVRVLRSTTKKILSKNVIIFLICCSKYTGNTIWCKTKQKSLRHRLNVLWSVIDDLIFLILY